MIFTRKARGAVALPHCRQLYSEGLLSLRYSHWQASLNVRLLAKLCPFFKSPRLTITCCKLNFHMLCYLIGSRFLSVHLRSSYRKKSRNVALYFKRAVLLVSFVFLGHLLYREISNEYFSRSDFMFLTRCTVVLTSHSLHTAVKLTPDFSFQLILVFPLHLKVIEIYLKFFWPQTY